MRTPRRPWSTPIGALATVVLLSLAGCAPVEPEPQPSVPTAGPPTTVVLPRSSTTTVPGPTISPEPNQEANWTFVVVRHANLADDGADPPLTEAGDIRARRLADLIYTYGGVATYATRFRRSQDTARPTAELWEVPVTSYDIKLPPAELVNRIKQRHPQGAILIVGDSDTVPGIVGELCRCRIDPIPQNDYANRYEITLRPDSTVLNLNHYTSY